MSQHALVMQARRTIEIHGMFERGESALVCVSGGADSIALLFVLLELRGALGLGNISALHVNHNLREGAKNDEEFVARACGALGVRLEARGADVAALAREHGTGLEEAGRIARHGLAEETRAMLGAHKIAMGHNMDDCAETVIFNLCRGAGLRGACGIPPSSGRLVRPLLGSPRRDILGYLSDIGQPHAEDPSNSSCEFTRNRIRHKIMPALAREVNGSAARLIARAAGLFSLDEDYLGGRALEAFGECVSAKGRHAEVCAQKLRGLHPAISSRVLRVLLGRFGLRDVGHAHISELLALAAGESGRKFELGGVAAAKSRGKLLVGRPGPAGFSYRLEPEKPAYIPEIGGTVLLSRGSRSPAENMPAPYCTNSLKHDNMSGDFVMRTRLPGDRIRLKSAGGKRFSKKLKGFFMERGIPDFARDSVPLLAIGGDVAWIVHDFGKQEYGVTNCDYLADRPDSLRAAIWEGDHEQKWRK